MSTLTALEKQVRNGESKRFGLSEVLILFGALISRQRILDGLRENLPNDQPEILLTQNLHGVSRW